jgi:hypothetical protein
MRKLVPLFFILLFIISCSDKKKIPKGVLPQAKMQAVLWDMISAGEFLTAYVLNKDSVDKMAESSKLYGQTLQFHHITREDFDKSYLFYQQHPALMKVILDSLSKKQVTPIETFRPQIDTVKKNDTLKLQDTLRKRILKRSVL